MSARKTITKLMKWQALMLPSKTTIEETGNMQGMHIDMEFDASSLAHIMSVLTNLYSDPESAVIREYSTNALDSHIAAGQTRPIEVILPSNFSRYFKIKDYGLGLSVEDVKNVYSKYGASTKRGTNEQAGMLGLGCKSALTYADQFIVNAIKDGEACSVVVHRTTNGSGAMEVLNIHKTDEPNGVEIVIPTKPISGFDKKVARFFSFWEKGKALVNDKDLAGIAGIRINDQFILADSLPDDYVVMGGIAYPMGNMAIINRGGYNRNSLVAFVDIGAVDFTPSREELHFTEKTNKALRQIGVDFSKAAGEYVENAMKAAPDHAAALKQYHEWRNKAVFSNYIQGIRYKSSVVPSEFDFDKGVFYQRNRYYNSAGGSLYSRDLDSCIIVTNFQKDKLHPYSRKKLILWLEVNDRENKNVYFTTEDSIDDPWLEHVEKVDWSTIQSIKLPRNETAVATSTYKVLKKNNTFDSVNSLVDPIYYVSNAELKKYNTYNNVNILTLFNIDQVVLINKGSWDRFIKKFPGAVHLFSHMKQQVKDYFELEFPKDKEELALANAGVPWYSKLDANVIDDPAIKDYLSKVKVKSVLSNKIKRYEEMIRLAVFFGIKAEALGTPSNPFSSYSLLPRWEPSYLDNSQKEQMYCYMNAWYNQTKDKNAV